MNPQKELLWGQRVEGTGCEVQGSGLRGWASGFGLRVEEDLGFRV